ncbi:unnamed protein product, partial [marine sediment metagenome]
DFRVDTIAASAGEIYEITFYSIYLFQSAAGTLLLAPTQDSDIFMGEDDLYNVFLEECRWDIANQLQGKNASFDKTGAEDRLFGTAKDPGLYHQYKIDHPSEAIKLQNVYYDINLFKKSRRGSSFRF